MAEHTKLPWGFAPTFGRMRNVYSQSHGIMSHDMKVLIAGCFMDIEGDEDAAHANAAFIVAACNNYARLREENAALVEALSEYVILGHGKCTIGERAFLMGSAALAKSREGNGGNNG